MTMSEELAWAVGGIGIAVTVITLALTLRHARREVPIRRGLEFARVVLGAIGLVVIGMVGSVSTPLVLAVLAVLVGLALGFVQGRTIHVTVRDGRQVARRTVWGVAVWFSSLAVMQAAGVVNRTGAFRLGQAAALAGIAVVAGIMVGRSSTSADRDPVRGAPTGVATFVVLSIALLAAVVGPPESSVRAQSAEEMDLACSVIPRDAYEWKNATVGSGGIDGQAAQCEFQVGTSGSVLVDVYSDSAAAAEEFAEFRTRSTPVADVDFGDEGFIDLPGSDDSGPEGFDFVRLRRGRFIVVIRIGSTEENLAFAPIIDGRIVEVAGESLDGDPESDPDDPESAGTPDDTGTDPDEAGAGQDPEDAAPVGEGPDPFVSTDPGDAGGGGGDDHGLFDLGEGEIDPDESLAISIGAVLVAVGMGVLTLTEAEVLFGTAMESDTSDEAVVILDSALNTPRSDTFEPLPTHPAAGGAGVETASPGSPLDAPPLDSEPAEPTLVPEEGQIEESPPDPDDGESIDGAPPPPGGIQLSDREIDDIVRWGLDNNRPVGDIQGDLDGLNQARGGTGPVPLPGNIRTIHDPDFGTITAESDAIYGFRGAQADLRDLDQWDADLRARWDEIQTRRTRYRGLEEAPHLRGVVALQEALDLQDSYDRQIADLDEEISDILRSGRMGEGASDADYFASQERENWEQNRYRIPSMREQISDLESKRDDRISQLYATGEGTPIEGSSLANRPGIVLDQLDREQDELMADFRRIKDRQQQLRSQVESFLTDKGKDPTTGRLW